MNEKKSGEFVMNKNRKVNRGIKVAGYNLKNKEAEKSEIEAVLDEAHEYRRFVETLPISNEDELDQDNLLSKIISPTND